MDSPSLKNSNTPLKRLGLSRKKSSPFKNFCTNQLTDMSACDASPSITRQIPQTEIIKCDEARLQELNLKLSNLNDTVELEESIKMWKAGCKEALIDLQTWLKTEENLQITLKELIDKLGISSVILETFSNDPDIVDE